MGVIVHTTETTIPADQNADVLRVTGGARSEVRIAHFHRSRSALDVAMVVASATGRAAWNLLHVVIRALGVRGTNWLTHC